MSTLKIAPTETSRKVGHGDAVCWIRDQIERICAIAVAARTATAHEAMASKDAHAIFAAIAQLSGEAYGRAADLNSQLQVEVRS